MPKLKHDTQEQRSKLIQAAADLVTRKRCPDLDLSDEDESNLHSWLSRICCRVRDASDSIYDIEKEFQHARPIAEWHEDYGPCIFWRSPVDELPYVGSPLETGFDAEYYTHFTRLPTPLNCYDGGEIK